MHSKIVQLTVVERYLQEELMQADESPKEDSVSSLTWFMRRHAIHKSVELLAPEWSKMNLHYIITNMEKKEAKIFGEAQSKLSYYALLAKYVCTGKELMDKEQYRRHSLSGVNVKGPKLLPKETVTSSEKEHCVYRLVEAEHSKLSSLGSLDDSLDVLIHAKEAELLIFETADSRSSYFELIVQQIRMIEECNQTMESYAIFLQGAKDVMPSYTLEHFHE